jgi:predicted transcriptional regulator of viral defense system
VIEFEKFIRDRNLFNWNDLTEFIETLGPEEKRSRDSVLAEGVKRGWIEVVKNGLYAVSEVPGRKKYVPNPYLIAARIRPKGVLSHYSALYCLKEKKNPSERYFFSSIERLPTTLYGGYEFHVVKTPYQLLEKGVDKVLVTEKNVDGEIIRVTEPERILADVFVSRFIGDGKTDAWKTPRLFGELDIDKLIYYIKLLKSPPLAARVGLFLERNQDVFSPGEKRLDELSALKPAHPKKAFCPEGGVGRHFLENESERKEGENVYGKRLKRWNLYAPHSFPDFP